MSSVKHHFVCPTLKKAKHFCVCRSYDAVLLVKAVLSLRLCPLGHGWRYSNDLPVCFASWQRTRTDERQIVTAVDYLAREGT